MYGTKSYIANIKDSMFKNNSATSEKGSIQGPLWFAGAHIQNIENTKFIGNTANAGTNAIGGAMYFAGVYSGGVNYGVIDVIKDSLFENNSANAGEGNYTAVGGAISIRDGAAISEIRNTDFNSNHATTNGGAIHVYNNPQDRLMNIYESSFTSNTAGTNGGALYLQRARYENISDTEFINNRIINDSSNSSLYGGAINITDSSNIQNLSGLTFTGNGITATNSRNGNKHGGALFSNSTIGSITDSTFTGNFIENDSNNETRGGALLHYPSQAPSEQCQALNSTTITQKAATLRAAHCPNMAEPSTA